MKNKNYFRTLIGALLLGTAITACDKFEDDVPPARMANLALNDDSYTTTKNHSVQLNVLANDTIGSSATLSFTQPQIGNIITDSIGNVYYQPAPNFVGTDVFTYKACLDDNCATANVTITVKNDSINTCTVKAFDDTKTFVKNMNDTIFVLQNDILCGNANTSLNIVQQPMHGQAMVFWGNQIFYMPNSNYVGPDEITYAISNSNGQSTAKVLLNVINSNPTCVTTANPDTTGFTRHLGAIDTVSIAVMANDIICPNGGVSLQLPSPSTQFANLILTNNGTHARIIYMTKPNAPRNIIENFQYRICQGNNCSNGNVRVHLR